MRDVIDGSSGLLIIDSHVVAGGVAIWSAGCAAGEEPYSMAMVIRHDLGQQALRRVRIIATDASERALREARDASYGEWSFRGVERGLRDRYFEPTRDGRHRPVSEIRAAVRFEQMELRQRAAQFDNTSLDAVFFRNVAIYLTDAAIGEIHDEIRRVLRPGALLVQGLADPRPRFSWPAGLSVAPGPERPSPQRQTRACARATPAATVPGMGAAMDKNGHDASPSASASDPIEALESNPVVHAFSLANRGRLEEGLLVLDRAIQQQGASAHLLSLRGQLHLARGDAQAGAVDLRAALYLQGDDPLARFHYACSLKQLHRSRQCELQLLDVLRGLEGLPDEHLLADEHTTAASRRRAAQELMRRVA